MKTKLIYFCARLARRREIPITKNATKSSSSGAALVRLVIVVSLFLSALGMTLPAITPQSDTTSSISGPSPQQAPAFPNLTGSSANQLPPGVPMPQDAKFSLNNRQSDPLSSSPSTGLPGFKGLPLRPSLRAGEISEPEAGLDAPLGRKPGTASGANSLAKPVFANQQPAPLSMQQPAASESMPLASASQIDWSIVNSANGTATEDTNLLNGVTCVSASNCWAVGQYWTGITYQTMIERWDGTSWAIVRSPNATTTSGNYLDGVTCVSASDCWAVGYISARTDQTLVEHWYRSSL